MLEILVNSQVREPAALAGHRFIKLEVPDEIGRLEVNEAHLPPDSLRRFAVTRAWGDRWLSEGQRALLIVRSVLVPETYNILINPLHADAARIRRIATFPYPLDSRLFSRESDTGCVEPLDCCRSICSCEIAGLPRRGVSRRR